MKPRFFDPTVKHLAYLYTLIVPSLDAGWLHQLWPRHPGRRLSRRRMIGQVGADGISRQPS
jgi:hypothetical protein